MMAGGTGIDPDAVAFLTAAGITDATITLAIDTLVKDIKGYGIWIKMKAIYPFVGGTATTHKFNLKDPQDTNAAFRLVFSGGWTHSATGALPNGTNAYADTFFNPTTNIILNDIHLGYYSGTLTSVANYAEMGVSGVGTTTLDLRLTNTTLGSLTQIFSTFVNAANLDSRGFYIGSRISNEVRLAKNGTVIAQNLSLPVSGTKPNANIWIGARNNVAGTFTNREARLSSIGDGLNASEISNYYTAVQSFQTTLGRQV
jgi:hypothetical protein